MSKHWLYTADISWVVNHDKMSLIDKANKVYRFLRGLPPFRSPEHRTVLTELVDSTKEGAQAFEDKLEVLYNFCDYHRIWLSA